MNCMDFSLEDIIPMLRAPRTQKTITVWSVDVAGAVNDVGGDNVWKIYPLGK